MTVESRKERKESKKPSKECREKKNGKWEKPTLEDVSGKVMAQPYIRFT